MKPTVHIRLGTLKRIIAEALMLEEDEDPVSAELTTDDEEGEDSLDSQVDKLLIDYESEAKSAKTEGRDWRRTVKRLLGEAEDDEEEDEGDEAPEGSEVSDSPDEVDKPSVDDIDVESYVTSVVRLVENYENLIEIRNTIFRRAANFLAKNYDESVVNKFKDELEESHGIQIGKSKRDVEDEQFAAPKAGEAGPFGMGGGGGGAPV